MISSQSSFESGRAHGNNEAKPAAGNGSNTTTTGSKFARYFPEDPFSGGILMAEFKGDNLLYKRDTYFQAKLTTAERILFEKDDVYLLAFELNFMKSFSPQYRFRGADVSVTIEKVGTSEPSITKIFPTVFAAEVSEREVQDTNEVTAGAGASAGGGNVDASVKQTHNDTTKFKGIRKFHGLIKQDNVASWRLYEEPRSHSGIPAIFRFVTLVRCLKGGFTVHLEASARMVKWPKLFDLHRISLNSSYSAVPLPLGHIISPQPVPFDWGKLHKEAEKISPEDDNDKKIWNRYVNEFKAECEAANTLSGETKKIVVGFGDSFVGVGRGIRKVEAMALARLKEDLAGEKESKRFIRRLEKEMEVSKRQVSSKSVVKSADGPSAGGTSADVPDSWKPEVRIRKKVTSSKSSSKPAPASSADDEDSSKPKLSDSYPEQSGEE